MSDGNPSPAEREMGKSELIRRLLKNAGFLLSGRLVGDLLGFVSIVIAARTLGPELFGTLVLIQTYVFTVDLLINFQSWQALVKYGAAHFEAGNKRALKGLFKVGIYLDISTAVLGCLVAATAALWVGYWQNWDGETVDLARLYSIVILFNIAGAPTAIIRLADRFKLPAFQSGITGVVRLTGAAIAAVYDLCFPIFLGIWMTTDIAGFLTKLYLGWKVYREQGLVAEQADGCKAVLRENPGLLRFVLTTNAHSTVRMSTNEFDLLVVAGILGAPAAGLFKVVKQISGILIRTVAPLSQAIYPELAKKWATQQFDEFRHLIRSSIWMGMVPAVLALIAFAAVGDLGIEYSFGSEYVAAYETAIIYLAAVAIAMSSFAYPSVMLSMGRSGESFKILLVATVVYYVVLVPALRQLGLPGAAWSYLIYYVCWAILMWRAVLRGALPRTESIG